MRATFASEHTTVIPYASVESDDDAPACTRAGALLVEVALSWGGELLALRHARPRGVLRVSDLDLPIAAGSALALARVEGGEVGLVLPNGRRLPPRCRMTLRLGRATLRVALVADDADALPRPRGDGRVARGLAVAAVAHAMLAAVALYGRAPAGDEEAAARATMEKYLAAAEARAEADAADFAFGPPKALESVAEGPSPVKEAGLSGNPTRQEAGGRDRRARGAEARKTSPGDVKPEDFGLLAILSSQSRGDRAGRSAFADFEGPGAMGSIFGATIEDAAGFGGLGLSGSGEGGGGKGQGVPIGALGGLELSGTGGGGGTCATEDCRIGLGAVGAIGRAGGRMLSGTHVPRAPIIVGEEISTTGRLPPEAVQRVVRQSFGRLRACYEQGLARDPGLEGRIAVKFVIDREGQVAMTSVAERSLPDSSVAECVERAYRVMSFPKPAGGIVTVVYPIVFEKA